ncbi:TPA: type VI secretion system lipoprotein TssJ, partial [Vibrio diabolicus]
MKRVYQYILLLISMVLFGCSAANLVVDPYSDLEITANHNINPDSNG